MIEVRGLQKHYRVHRRQAGAGAMLRSLFHRSYELVKAVNGIDFSVGPGERVGFPGPNGAGKTTTLKMLSGLLHPTAGQVKVAGFTPRQREPDFLKQVTLVMGQKQQLIWDLPAVDSFRINAAVYDISPDQYRQRIDEMAQMLGLKDEIFQPVRKLSLGERMKAELMAALLHRPAVLFLDEPTLGLDVNAQTSVRSFLRGYNQRYGATILLTSHYMADITALCPRVILIHHGSLIYDGSLEDIRRRFAPWREVKIELAGGEARAADLARFGEVIQATGREARLIVTRDALTHSVEQLLDALEVEDLTVTDPPIEEVIGRLFKDGIAAEAKTEN